MGFDNRLRRRIVEDANSLRLRIGEQIENNKIVADELDAIVALHRQLGQAIERASVASAHGMESSELVTDSFDRLANSSTLAINQEVKMVRAEGIIYILENAPVESIRAALKFVSEATIDKWREELNNVERISALDGIDNAEA